MINYMRYALVVTNKLILFIKEVKKHFENDSNLKVMPFNFDDFILYVECR